MVNDSVRSTHQQQPEVTPWGQLQWLIGQDQTPGAEQTFGVVTIKPNQRNPLHSHPNCEELLYLLSGQLDHSLEDRVFRLNPGDAIRVPAGVKHDARCVGEEPATMIVCYSAGQREMQAYE